MSVGSATAFKAPVSAPDRPTAAEEEAQPDSAGTSLDDLTTPAQGSLDAGLFDDGSEFVSGSVASESVDPALVTEDDAHGTKFDWPDLSAIVELLVAQSSRELVADYRLPGDDGRAAAKKKKKKKSKEELLALAKSRRKPRSPFSQGFHVVAAAFIGTFLVIVVLRRSGRGSYWW